MLHDLYMSPGSWKSSVKMTDVLSKEDLGKARLKVLSSISAASGGSVGCCPAGSWGFGRPNYKPGGQKSGRARMQHLDHEPSPRLLLTHQEAKEKVQGFSGGELGVFSLGATQPLPFRPTHPAVSSLTNPGTQNTACKDVQDTYHLSGSCW